MRTHAIQRALVLLIAVPLFPLTARGQNMDTVQVTVQKLSDRVYVLFGSGGNIGLSVGDDGAFIVDDQMPYFDSLANCAIASSVPVDVGTKLLLKKICDAC